MELKMAAQAVQTDPTYVPVTLRAHTILGVCEAIGEDFGFNPIWVRVPFAASVLISPTMAVGAYLALGVVVMLSRVLFPRPKAAKVKIVVEPAVPANEQQELAKAA
jgi:phage shock protein C